MLENSYVHILLNLHAFTQLMMIVCNILRTLTLQENCPWFSDNRPYSDSNSDLVVSESGNSDASETASSESDEEVDAMTFMK